MNMFDRGQNIQNNLNNPTGEQQNAGFINNNNDAAGSSGINSPNPQPMIGTFTSDENEKEPLSICKTLVWKRRKPLGE